MRSVATLPARGASRARVLVFLQRRIDCCKLWVLMHQLRVPTRGCTSTSRVEGTHGRDRVDDRITARNSWYTSVRRNSERSARRLRARVAWARRQIGSQLLRSPMNPDVSAFKQKDLDGMDAVMLPWAVECLEDQAALGSRFKVAFTKKGRTKQTKSNDTSREQPFAGEFKVWYDDLCNMDIVSKIKYHAALHGRGDLFKHSTDAFKPTIPCQVAHDFFRMFDPKPQSEQSIPQNGLPSDDDDVDYESNSPLKTAASSKLQGEGVDRREIQPTEFGVSNLLMDTWNFTNRFSATDKNAARKLIRQRLLELQNEIKAMETQNVRSEDLHRRFSKRDMFNGNAQRRRK